MSVIIIGTGGGHRALEQLSHKSSTMTHEQRVTAQALVDKFVQDAHALLATLDD